MAKTIFYSLAALVRKILFFHSKIKFISSRHVISSIYIFYSFDKVAKARKEICIPYKYKKLDIKARNLINKYSMYFREKKMATDNVGDLVLK